MKAFARDNTLSLFFGLLFVGALAAQSFAGQHATNAERAEHGEAGISWFGYVSSADFGSAVMENWQSEFLQFALFIAATVWLVQKGSNESKRLEDRGRESNEQQRIGAHADERSPSWATHDDWRTRVYENSLLIVMASIFLLTWLAQSVNAWRVYADERRSHGSEPLSWGEYLLNADFWEATLQNWQSEFLAVGTMVIFTVYLRQRGSPESKPVGAPHEETGSEG